MKYSLLLVCLTLFAFKLGAQDYLKHEIEDEPQMGFPGITTKLKDGKFLHVIDLNKGSPSNYIFEKKTALKHGEKVKISSYVISKSIMDAMNADSLANKTNRKELVEASTPDERNNKLE